MPQESIEAGGTRPAIVRSFPPESTSAPKARRFVLAAGWSDEADVNLRLATLVSELVTNAILHARTAFLVSVTIGEDAIRVAVSDGSTDLPAKRSYGSDQPTGRGLHIVDAFADRWGVDPEAPGKTVWFELEHEKAAI